MKNILTKLKYGITKDEYNRIKEMWKENKGEALWYCKRMGYKRLVQHLQQKF